jgi:hypothetical protein
MNRFASRRAEEIHQTGLVSGVPPHVARRACRIMDLLVSAHDIQDVRLIGDIWRWPKLSRRLGLQIEEKWFITFEWEPDFGAKEIEIERR